MHQKETVMEWTEIEIRQWKVPIDRHNFLYSYESVIYSKISKLNKVVTWTMKHLIIT